MSQQNKDRFFTNFLKDFCEKQGIQLLSHSQDWLFSLKKGGQHHLIIGYDMGLNKSSSQQIAKDKCATFDILRQFGTPCVEHKIFHSLALSEYIDVNGTWLPIIKYFEDNSKDIVCKPVDGTGGVDVKRVRTQVELESTVGMLFQRCRSISLSPFERINDEYRAVILRDHAEIIFRKVRPFVVGDGHSTLRMLCGSIGTEPDESVPLSDLDSIPASGAVLTVRWKHNLGGGAQPQIISADTEIFNEVERLARLAMRDLGLEFASVDIISDADKSLKVIEINSGVMLESFSRSSIQNREMAYRIYERALKPIFSDNLQ